MPNFNFLPGIYSVLAQRLRVRTTKVAQITANYARDEQSNPIVFTQGMKVPVYRIEYSPPGWVWGVVSPPGAPQTQYSCLYDKQTVFAEWESELDGTNEPPSTAVGTILADHEQRIKRLEKLTEGNQ